MFSFFKKKLPEIPKKPLAFNVKKWIVEFLFENPEWNFKKEFEGFIYQGMGDEWCMNGPESRYRYQMKKAKEVGVIRHGDNAYNFDKLLSLKFEKENFYLDEKEQEINKADLENYEIQELP